MKKQLLLLVMMMLLPMIANAEPVEIDGIYYNLIQKAKIAEVTSNPNRYSGDVIIPKEVEFEGMRYAVTSIRELAFHNCSLTSITIPNSVTSIGSSAFSLCYDLTSITISNSVTSIGYNAFKDCNRLSSVHISDIAAWCMISFGDYFSNPLYYAQHLFLNGVEIKELVIPDGVTSIGENAFYNCTNFTSITIPNSVTSIGSNAFRYCSSLTSITIPNSVTSIENCTFCGCTSLISIMIPNSVTNIGESAFLNCSSLTSITIPNSVTSIGYWTFSECSSLTSITIPNSVTSIGNWTFSECSSLISITIPNSVTSIGYWAFKDCVNLNDVYCYVEKVPSTYDNAFEGSYIEFATLHVPESSIEAYKSTEPWNGFKNIIKIMPMFSLTYIVDNELYKSYQVEEGATITSEAAPTKEGYTFSGWSEIPETMPAHDVTITGVFIKNTPIEKCATPTIVFNDGKLVFNCETEGVEYVSEITVADNKKNYSNEVCLTGIYKVSVYATKAGYENSETVTKEIDVRGLMGDMNEDGSLSVTDVTILIDKILKQK